MMFFWPPDEFRIWALGLQEQFVVGDVRLDEFKGFQGSRV